MAGFVLPYSGEEVKQALDKAMANKDVSGASVNSLGHLILSFTDGSTLDCGYVGAELTAKAIIQALGYVPANENDIPPAYTGAYSVVPDTTEQILPTAGRITTDNIHVQSIPFYEVSNEQGGVSVYIGS